MNCVESCACIFNRYKLPSERHSTHTYQNRNRCRTIQWWHKIDLIGGPSTVIGRKIHRPSDSFRRQISPNFPHSNRAALRLWLSSAASARNLEFRSDLVSVFPPAFAAKITIISVLFRLIACAPIERFHSSPPRLSFSF